MIALSRKARLDRVALLRTAAANGAAPTNGIVAVDLHEGGPTLRLDVECIFDLPAVPDNIRATQVSITGGVRRPEIAVTSVHREGRVLHVHVARRGDFSEYTLRIAGEDGRPLPGFDPLLSDIRFGFRRQCDDGFDCQTDDPVPGEPLAQAPIDYRARDYQGFRRLMLDRMAQLMPGWTEPPAASQDVTLVEMLAHVADRIAYAQDRVATEAYLDTATLRRSAKLHARLVDYDMHDGCNARTFVHIGLRQPADPAAATSVTIRPGARFLTGIPGVATATERNARVDAALGDRSQNVAVFEAMEQAACTSRRNRMVIHDFAGAVTEIARGATGIVIADPRGDLGLVAGDLLLLEQVAEPETGDATADFRRRHVVRLTGVTALTDPVGAEDDDGNPVALSLLELRWDPADALPDRWPLARVTTNDTIDGIPPGPGQPSVIARGNIVAVDHGISDGRDTVWPLRRPGRRRAVIALSGRGITQAIKGMADKPASALLTARPDRAVPELRVTQDSGSGAPSDWAVVRDLLDATDERSELVLDIEADGSASLRSGDGTMGRIPDPDVPMQVRYRIGNGPDGNVGAEAIRHVVTEGHEGLGGAFLLGFAGNPGDVVTVRNVVPAVGGTAPQTIAEARRLAPLQFHEPLRAITPEDYARFAAQHDQVAAARGIERWTGSWKAVVLLLDRAGGARIDDAFEREMRAFLEPYRLAGHALEFRDPQLVPLEVEMRVCVDAGTPVDVVEEQLRALFSSRVLADGRLGLFHPDVLSFGSVVRLSQLYAAAHSVPGVRHADITALRRQGEAGGAVALDTGIIAFGEYEIPILENRRDYPDRGRLRLHMEGGA